MISVEGVFKNNSTSKSVVVVAHCTRTYNTVQSLQTRLTIEYTVKNQQTQRQTTTTTTVFDPISNNSRIVITISVTNKTNHFQYSSNYIQVFNK